MIRIDMIKDHCLYGMTHFCDGKPNYSECDKGTPRKPPCKFAKSSYCPVRIGATLKEEQDE